MQCIVFPIAGLIINKLVHPNIPKIYSSAIIYIRIGWEIRKLLFYTIYLFYGVVRKSLKGGVPLNYPLYVLNTSSGKVDYLGEYNKYHPSISSHIVHD